MDPTTYESFKTPQRQILQGALTLPHPISGLERMVRTWANHKFNYGSGSSFRFFMEPGLNLNPRIHFCLNLLSKNLEIHTGHPKYNSENSLLALQCHMRWYILQHTPSYYFPWRNRDSEGCVLLKITHGQKWGTRPYFPGLLVHYVCKCWFHITLPLPLTPSIHI